MEVSVPAPHVRRGGRNSSVAWLVIVAVATFLRVWPIASGLPYSDYIDEGHVLHQAIKVLQERTYDVGLYDYPSLPAYLIAGAAAAFSPVYRLSQGHALQEDFPRPAEFHTELGDVYDLISPPAFIVLARVVVAALSVGAVVLTGILTLQIAGRMEALLAVLLMAVCPAAVSRGSTVIVDTVGTFFVLATLCFCARACRRQSASDARATRDAALAGAAAALAFVSKYPLGAVGAAVLVTVLMRDARLMMRLRLLLFSASAFIAMSVIAMPPLILKPWAVLTAWPYLVRNYEKIHSDPGYLGQSITNAELGWLLVPVGVLGIVFMLWNTARSRAIALSWIAFALMLLGGLVWSSFQPFRNLLSLVPLLCIAAAILICHLHRRLTGAAPIARVIIPTACVLLVVSLTAHAWQHIRHRMTQVDTRVQAIDWLQQHTRSDDCIIALRELAILPSEWKRISAHVQVVPWRAASDLLARESFDYVVTGEADLQLAPDAAGWSAYREHWVTVVSSRPTAAAFGHAPMFIVPYFWRTNDERIVVLR